MNDDTSQVNIAIDNLNSKDLARKVTFSVSQDKTGKI